MLNNIDLSLAEKVDDITTNMKKTYNIKGKKYLNVLYHYGIFSDWWTRAREGTLDKDFAADTLYMYDEFKKNVDRKEN